MSYRKIVGDMTLAKKVRFTASGDVADGSVVAVGPRFGVAYNNTKDGEDGLAVVATDEQGIRMPKANTEVIARGVALYWDADGDPQGGTAGTGAVTATSTGNTFLGYAAAAATAVDTEVVTELVDRQG